MAREGFLEEGVPGWCFTDRRLRLRHHFRLRPQKRGWGPAWFRANTFGFIGVNIYGVWIHRLIRFWSQLLRHHLQTGPSLSDTGSSLGVHHPNQPPRGSLRRWVPVGPLRMWVSESAGETEAAHTGRKEQAQVSDASTSGSPGAGAPHGPLPDEGTQLARDPVGIVAIFHLLNEALRHELC